MEINKGKIHEEFDRDTYWTRIYFESEDKKYKSTVLACASWEYFMDTNRVNEITKRHLEEWREKVIKEYESLGDKIFDKKVHYGVYAQTPEGKINGLEFLQKEISP